MIERAIIFILIFGSLTSCSSETPEERAALCVWQKNQFTRGRLCDAVYDIGDQFLKDPTSTWMCSDDEIKQHIKWTSTLYKHQLNKCTSDEANYYIYNIYDILRSSGARFAICGTRSDGKDLHSETEKNTTLSWRVEIIEMRINCNNILEKDRADQVAMALGGG